ncbi:MAG: YceK/YidQ family lipoprotein [Clostridiales bacterium]|nr:YceK/YidQ family lipoprotein [Clostridiales bacterium]
MPSASTMAICSTVCLTPLPPMVRRTTAYASARWGKKPAQVASASSTGVLPRASTCSGCGSVSTTRSRPSCSSGKMYRGGKWLCRRQRRRFMCCPDSAMPITASPTAMISIPSIFPCSRSLTGSWKRKLMPN